MKIILSIYFRTRIHYLVKLEVHFQHKIKQAINHDSLELRARVVVDCNYSMSLTFANWELSKQHFFFAFPMMKKTLIYRKNFLFSLSSAFVILHSVIEIFFFASFLCIDRSRHYWNYKQSLCFDCNDFHYPLWWKFN